MRLLKLLLLIAVAILLFVFVRQNAGVLSQPVSFQLNLYVKQFESPPHALWELMVFALLLGVVTTGLYCFATIWRQRSLNRKLLHDLELLKAEVAQLKPAATPPPETPPAGS